MVMAKAMVASEQVVVTHADTIKRGVLPSVVGDDEGEVVNEVCNIVAEDGALFQGFYHQCDIPLLEMPYAAANKFCRSGGGPRTEVRLFEEADRASTYGGIKCGADAGRAATDGSNVPRSMTSGKAR